LHGDNSKKPSTTLHWPKQGSPNSSTWKVWSKVITHLYCVKSHSGILRKENKLGHWITSNIHLTTKKFMNTPIKEIKNGFH